jgi:DNA-binding NarL/FixJ family response regulator
VTDDRQRIRILVVDDHAVVRSGFRRLLELDERFEVVGEAADGRSAVRMARSTQPDVVLMDIRMPDLDGIEATRRITSTTGARVVVLTTFDLDQYVYDALSAGASGFLLKECRPEELTQAIEAAASGAALFSHRLVRGLVEQFVRRPDGASGDELLERLSARERDVFERLARGRSNREIAADLVVEESTVKSHVTNVLAKLGARDRIHAVVLAYEHGVVKPGDLAED